MNYTLLNQTWRREALKLFNRALHGKGPLFRSSTKHRRVLLDMWLPRINLIVCKYKFRCFCRICSNFSWFWSMGPMSNIVAPPAGRVEQQSGQVTLLYSFVYNWFLHLSILSSLCSGHRDKKHGPCWCLSLIHRTGRSGNQRPVLTDDFVFGSAKFMRCVNGN